MPTLPLDPFPEGHGAASLPSPAFPSPPLSQPFHTLWLFPSGRSQTALMELRSPGHIGRASKTLRSLNSIGSYKMCTDRAEMHPISLNSL